MRAVFDDTFYFQALLDSREARYTAAVEAARNPELQLVTTEWVLAEFGDAYCHREDREDFVSLYCILTSHPRVKIISADTLLFQRGVDLFAQRRDKDWSLTDCLSFIAMKDEQITEALTGDKHFEQAGFTALLK